MFTDQNVHMVWIGPELSLLEYLTIKLFQRQNMQPVLWAFNEIKNIPLGVELRDATEILPLSSVFRFRNEEDGGAVALWTDQFQLRLLQKYGGWYSQLDVACLKMPPPCEYYFCPHTVAGVDVCVMKTPKDAPFIQPCLTDLESKFNAHTSDVIDWEDSLRAIGSCIQSENLSGHITKHFLTAGYAMYMNNEEQVPPEDVHFIHWWSRTIGDKKNHPKPGTFYYHLLKQEHLI